jgi:hypothetical protein
LWTAIQFFVKGGPQGDDMTALVLCRKVDEPVMEPAA